MNYEIEKGIPYRKTENDTDLPLYKMKSGDSILLTKQMSKQVYAKFYYKIKKLKKKMGINDKFKLGRDPRTGTGLRLWKLAS